MIYKLEIVDIENSNFDYFGEHPNPEVLNVEFKKGLNVVIGNNGSGKTTLINMLAEYTFCTKGSSQATEESVRHLMDFDGHIKDGIIVKNNYNISTYKTILNHEKTTEDTLGDFRSFASTFFSKQMSDGQKNLLSIKNVFGDMFNGEKNEFNKWFLDQKYNDLWGETIEGVKKYITENLVEEDDPIYAVIMDEPDRNLDVENIGQLLTIFTNQKPNGQMIVTLHNPILIYKLSKLKDVNFIQLIDKYLDQIINLIEN